MSRALDPLLREILACPAEHHAALDYDEVAGELTCTECGLVFVVDEDGIPNMLLDDARPRVDPPRDDRPT